MKKRIRKLVSFVMIVFVLTHLFGNVFVVIAQPESNNFSTSDIPETEDSFSDNEVIVVIDSPWNEKEYTIEDFESINCIAIKELSRNVKENELGKILKLTLSEHSKENVLSAIELLKLRDDIVFADPNYEISFCSTPNDEYYSTYQDQWAIDKISLPAAWNYTTGSAAVKVGIIDSGIDGTHPDLINRIDQNLSCNFGGDPTGSLYDPVGHGTMVAGIVGAQGNNSIGITGFCWNVCLVSLRVTDDKGKGSFEAIIEAVEYADEIGLPIVNMSVGIDNEIEKIDSLFVAISNYDGLFVCAAGNSSNDTDLRPEYPGAFRIPNLISVGASNDIDYSWYVSNYGLKTVDIFAPGEDIWSTFLEESYSMKDGSSFASPYVAGVAALMLSANPNLTARQLKQILMSNVDVVYDDAGYNVFGELCVSGGRLNAYKAVYAAVQHHPHEYYYIDEYCHSYNCEICEESIIEETHVFEDAYHVGHYSEHSEVCECGYMVPGWHTYEIYVNSILENEHYVYCRCGYFSTGYHVYERREGLANYHWYCRYCEKYVQSLDMPTPQSLVSGEAMILMSAPGVFTLANGMTLRILTESGSYVLSNGIIVLSNEDAALVEAGLLDPYELVENITDPSNPDLVTE